MWYYIFTNEWSLEEGTNMNHAGHKKTRGVLAFSNGNHSTIIEKAIPVIMYITGLQGLRSFSIGPINPKGGRGVLRVTCTPIAGGLYILVKGSGSQKFWAYFKNQNLFELARSIEKAFNQSG